MKNIIAVSQDPGGAMAISPVVRDLLEDDNLSVVTLDYGDNASRVFRTQGIPLTPLKEFGVEPPLESGFNSPKHLERILEETNTNLVITGTGVQKQDYSIDRAAILASRNLCPSLSVLDLWQNYRERFNAPYDGQLILPTKIAIMDEIAKQDMLEEGFPQEILEITGNPYFDSLSLKADEFDSEKRRNLREELGLLNFPIITYFSGPLEGDFGDKYGFNEKDSFRMLMDALSRFPEIERERIRILLKMHPREKPDNLDRIIGSYSQLRVIKNNSDSREVVLISDINISPFSTVLYEAVSMDRVALAIQPNVSPENERELFTYKFKDYIPVLKNTSSVFWQINSLLNNQKYVEQMAQVRKGIGNDGKAGERVKRLIYELIK